MAASVVSLQPLRVLPREENSGKRYVSVLNNSNPSVCQLELDSHADTCAVGKDALIIADWRKPTDVLGYDKSLGSKRLRTVSAVLGWIDPASGRSYHLVVNQALEVPGMDHHLLCPMQCRVNGVEINEKPRFMCDSPTPDSHCILAPDPEYPERKLRIPLFLSGVTSYTPVFKVTEEDYKSGAIPRVELTSESLDWDPQDRTFEQQESALVDVYGKLVTARPSSPKTVINELVSLVTPLADVTDDDNFAHMLESNVQVSSISKVERTAGGKLQSHQQKPIEPETLARRWNITPDKARQTVKRTTQRGVVTVLHPSRRRSTNDRMFRYRRLGHNMYTDTLFAETRSERGNKCAQVFGTDFGWSRAFPMERKGQAHEALSLLFKRDGVPPQMIMDNAKEQTEGDFARKLREANCYMRQTEPYSPWSNAAEGTVREVKRGSSRKMLKSGAPSRLWDHCLELEALVRSHTALDIFALNGEVPETKMFGETADITHISEFAWYEWVYWYDEKESYPGTGWVLGRYLGPSPDIGSHFTAKILKSNGQVVHRSTLRSLTRDELDSAHEADRRAAFDANIKLKLGRACEAQDFDPADLTPEHEFYHDDSLEDLGKLQPASPDEELASHEIREPTPEAGDEYVGVSISLPHGGSMARGRVVSRKRDHEDNPVGNRNANPILDTRKYLVEFDDGQVDELTANLIAESMYAQCDAEGNQYLLLDSFVDYRKTEKAISLTDQMITNSRGRPALRRTTAGWDFCVQWRDGSTSWEKLSLLKETHPVQTAEYAVAQGIDHEPAFNWWVKKVLKKRERIISLVRKRQTRYLRKTHKFGIECPKTVEEALALDKKNGNTLWQDAIALEMKNVRVAFKILEDGQRVPRDHQQIRCHMIFDVKMEDFRRKARFVAGGHTTETPKTLTYASVVGRETVRLALTLAALNDLEVKAADIMNAYITAPVTEKIYTVLGSEFGADAGKTAIIVRALYGLKSAGAAFRKHLGGCMRSMGYEPCQADPDLWMKPKTRPDSATIEVPGPNGEPVKTKVGGTKYWSYILCYVDDILCVDHDPMEVMKELDGYFKLKPGSVGDPNIYLGAKLGKVEMPNGKTAWGMSSSKYVQESCRNCRKHLADNYDGRFTLPKLAVNPFPIGYEPELDVSAELEPEDASYYQSIIGMLRWMIELGRIDIATEVSLLSSHLALPREGHLEAALHCMAYLEAKHNSRIVLDPTYPDIDARFKKCDWKEFYGDVEEALPPDMPEARGKPLDLRMFVDSDHAGEKLTRRSRTGFMIFANNALIHWLSKKQPTVETSVFGAEFVAMKNGMECLRGIRYKLRMMGVPVDAPSYIFGDNMSVVTNSSKPESTLKKKSNSICYHAVREAVAMGECLVAHIRTHWNFADLLTKVLHGDKRRKLVRGVLWDIYDDH